MRYTIVKGMVIAGVMLLAGIAGTAYAKDDDVTGTLTSITSTSVTVSTTTCSTNGSTEYEDSNGNTISRSRFAAGNQVRLRCQSSVAKNLKLLGSSGSSSSSSSSSSNSSNSSNSSSSSKSSSGNSSSSSSNSGDTKDRNLRDSLSAVDGVTTTAKGSFRFQSSRFGREQKLVSSVKIFIPSTTPAAASAEEGSILEITLTLFRKGTAYAQCTYKYDASSSTADVTELKVDVRKENAKLKNKKGFCDISLAKSGIQRGVPAVKKGDTMTLEETTAGVFMEGTL